MDALQLRGWHTLRLSASPIFALTSQTHTTVLNMQPNVSHMRHTPTKIGVGLGGSRG